MDDQFTDLSVPDLNDCYYISVHTGCKGFTHLMKLVLLVNKFPTAINIIKNILLDNPEEINKQNELGMTALIIASLYSNTYSSNEVVKLLIESGAYLNLKHQSGYTALMLASLHLNNETVQLLINAKADPNLSSDSEMKTALMLASSNSSCTSDNKTMKMLIDANADVNQKDIRGRTALWCADNFNTIELLINANADINLTDKQGSTFLIDYICTNNNDTINKDILEMLIVKSDKSITFANQERMTAYDHYIANDYNILDSYFLRLLKGEIVLANTKSARNLCKK